MEKHFNLSRYTTSEMNASIVDCPICMDAIEMTKNCVTTECGHCFHASCLMSNVAHNGFGCPYCRTSMADEPQNDEQDSEGEDDVWSDASDEEEIYDDDALRGLRFMTNNLEGVPHDILDVHDENEYNEELEQQTREQNVENNAPTAGYITEKLVAQGITMEQLVKCLMLNHEEYENENNDFDHIENDVFGKMRIIISNYRPTTDEAAEPVPRPVEPIAAPIPSPAAAPVAEPKTPSSAMPTDSRIACDAM
jgi:hypothetical protein